MRNYLMGGILLGFLMVVIPMAALQAWVEETHPVQPAAGTPASDAAADTQQPPAQTPPPQDDASGASGAASAPALSGGTGAVAAANTFRIYDARTKKVFTVDARTYTRGALAAEMPPSFHPEALKAQALAAHTYAQRLRQMRQVSPDPSLNGADFSADPQNWKTYTTEEVFRKRYGEQADAYWQTICEAADAVSGYLLTYEDEPIVAAYHSMSNGHTEDAANVWLTAEAYLIPVESRGDLLAPDYETTVTVSQEQAAKALAGALPDLELSGDPSAWLRVGERSASGYVLTVDVCGQTLAGKEVRSLLDLRSSDFDIAWTGAAFEITVRGYGHGVGLSQYGADFMARQGADFEEIVNHYYPGAALALARFEE